VLWDLAGQERFRQATRVYAVGAFVVFDVTQNSTYDAVKKWKLEVDKVTLPNSDEPIPVILLANKIDLTSWDKTPAEMDQFCKDHGFITWFETSAKTDTNIDKAMKTLVLTILEKVQNLPEGDSDDDLLIADLAHPPNNGCSC